MLEDEAGAALLYEEKHYGASLEAGGLSDAPESMDLRFWGKGC
jgi:hypothetical protein